MALYVHCWTKSCSNITTSIHFQCITIQTAWQCRPTVSAYSATNTIWTTLCNNVLLQNHITGGNDTAASAKKLCFNLSVSGIIKTLWMNCRAVLFGGVESTPLGMKHLLRLCGPFVSSNFFHFMHACNGINAKYTKHLGRGLYSLSTFYIIVLQVYNKIYISDNRRLRITTYYVQRCKHLCVMKKN